MKNSKFMFALILCMVFQSCCLSPFGCPDDGDVFLSESRYEPIFLDRLSFEASVKTKNSLAIGTSGKIYLKDNLLFINELNKGFHIYDNSDPSNPKAIKFLEAPGSTDMAIRSSMIYINQATDLIAVSYSSTTNEISLEKRIPDTFPQLISPDGFFAYDIPENNVIVGWTLKN